MPSSAQKTQWSIGDFAVPPFGFWCIRLRPRPVIPRRRDAVTVHDIVTIHTDGSCLSNPGPGGWAAILRWRDNEREIVGHEQDTTNNRMELKATIMGLRAGPAPCQLPCTQIADM